MVPMTGRGQHLCGIGVEFSAIPAAPHVRDVIIIVHFDANNFGWLFHHFLKLSSFLMHL